MRSRQRGFSLVEVLTTLVVMSVGMLGIAGLYVQSMQAGHSSMFRHHAVTLAGDVADRIRANPTAGIAYTAANVANIDCAAGGRPVWQMEIKYQVTGKDGAKVKRTIHNTIHHLGSDGELSKK